MSFDPACIDVEDYLECLNAANVVKATETEFRFSCPMPAHATGDETPSAYMNSETTAFFCHSCHAKGNAVTLAAQVLGVSPLRATQMLKQRYKPGGIDPDSRNMVEEITKVVNSRTQPIKRKNIVLNPHVLDAYFIDWNAAYARDNEAAVYLIEIRGFRVDTLRDWQFGWSGVFNRITLPVYDEQDQLVGVKARSINDRKPKYLNLRDEGIEPYLKNEIVFGLNRVKPCSELIIVEGEYNAIAMHDNHGYKNTVALNGSYFGERQIKLIREWTDCAYLFFDSDAAGYDAVRAVADALRPFIDVMVCPDHDGDPADMHAYSVRSCIEEARPWRELALLRS